MIVTGFFGENRTLPQLRPVPLDVVFQIVIRKPIGKPIPLR